LYSSEALLIPYPTIQSLFSAISSGSVDYSVVPTENSTNGPVNLTLDLLAAQSKDEARPKLKIVGETSVRVRQCLAGRRKGWRPDEAQTTANVDPQILPDLSHIASLHTHPQAWTQCTHFLDKHFGPEVPRHDEDSTSAAAELASKDETGTSAAICSSLAAELFGLEVLAGGIEGEDKNETRFLVLQQDIESKFEKPDDNGQGRSEMPQNGLIIAQLNPGSTESDLERQIAEAGFKKARLYWRRTEAVWSYVFLFGLDQVEESKAHLLKVSLSTTLPCWRDWGRWQSTR
jgi:prephenate dehydratase